MVKHISCDTYFNSPTCNWNQKCNNETFQCECKNYHTCKKDYSWNWSTRLQEWQVSKTYCQYFSVIDCDEILYVVDIV